MTREEALTLYFPMDDFRPGQFEIFAKAVDAFSKGHKFFVAEAPVGIGKSPVGFALLQYFKNGYYITTQKILQDQLVRDFGESGQFLRDRHRPLIELKGRNSYECLYDAMISKRRTGYRNCGDQSACIQQGQTRFDDCRDFCPYFLQKDKALASMITLFNFHSFTFHVGDVRRILVIDECHRIESTLMGMIRLSLSSKAIWRRLHYALPRFRTVAEYQVALRTNLLPLLEAEIASVKQNLPIDTHDLDTLSDWHKRLTHLCEAAPGDWVLEVKDKEGNNVTDDITACENLIAAVQGAAPTKWKYDEFTLNLAPVTVASYAEKFLFQYADHVFLMSGTILDLGSFLRGIGAKLQSSQEQYIRVPTIFPVKNRRIVKAYASPNGFNFKNKEQTLPLMVRAIEKICGRHPNQRGIIHAHSHGLARYIYNNVCAVLRSRILFQGQHKSMVPEHERLIFNEGDDFGGDREALLATHSQRQSSIILAPAMNEGLDLHDDLGRFQLICKMPWPGKSPQLDRREIIHPGYAAWLTAISFSQALGRVVRHPDDWGITYILDAGFDSFLQRHARFLPASVFDALEYEKEQFYDRRD